MADVRSGGAERVIRPEKIYLDRALKNRRITPDEGQLCGDTGIRDHDVEATESAHGLLDGLVDVVAVCHVTARPVRITGSGDVFEKIFLQASEGDPSAFGVQSFGQRSADATRCASDEHSAAGQRGRRCWAHRGNLPDPRTRLFTTRRGRWRASWGHR
jgi:hypothetical protein